MSKDNLSEDTKHQTVVSKYVIPNLQNIETSPTIFQENKFHKIFHSVSIRQHFSREIRNFGTLICDNFFELQIQPRTIAYFFAGLNLRGHSSDFSIRTILGYRRR